MPPVKPTVTDRTARRKIGTGKLIFISGLLVVLLSCALLAIWHRQSAARLQQQLAQLRADGEPITPAEMEAYYRLPEGREDCTQLYLQAFIPLEGQAFNLATAALPILGNTSDEADAKPPPPGQPWADLEAVEVFLKKLPIVPRSAARSRATRWRRALSHGFQSGHCDASLEYIPPA